MSHRLCWQGGCSRAKSCQQGQDGEGTNCEIHSAWRSGFIAGLIVGGVLILGITIGFVLAWVLHP